MKRRALFATPLLLATSARLAAQPESFSGQMRIIVPIGAGGVVDVITRLVADGLAQQLNVTTVVENKPGGQFAIGLQALSSAKPDGHTIGIVTMGMVGQMPALFPNLPYRLEDFQAIAPLADFRSVLVVPASSPIANLADYVARAKASKSPVLLGVTGVGGTPHLMIELLGMAANFSVEPINFPSEPASLQALLGGHIPATVASVANVVEHQRAGRVRILGFSGEKRHPAIPTVPTYIESGYPTVKGATWLGLFAPRGTPMQTINHLHKAVVWATEQASFKEKLPLDMEPFAASPAQLQELAIKDRARWTALIEERGLRNKVKS